MLRLAITTSAPHRADAERHLAAQAAAAAGDQHDLVGQIEKLLGVTHFSGSRCSAAPVRPRCAISCGIIGPERVLDLGVDLAAAHAAAYVFSSTMPSFQLASTR